jgi:hypothetical protein
MRLPDFQRQLPNGYVLIDTSSGVVSITDQQCSVLIGPTVDELGIRGATVMGHFTPYPQVPTTGVPGYFILDTHTGKLEQGLDRPAWEKRVGPSLPGLYKPVRMDTDRNEDLCR